jgi:hypothetical protein
MAKILYDDEGSETSDEVPFASKELAWTGRRRRRTWGGLLVSALVLAAIIHFKGWRPPAADAAYLMPTTQGPLLVSQVQKGVQGFLCPLREPAPAAFPADPPSTLDQRSMAQREFPGER